jgi:hypothetical protein
LKVDPWPELDGKDLARLVVRIATRGLERPFLVDRDLVLLHRQPEAAACLMLNYQSVPVRIVDVDQLIYGDDSVDRDFTPAEAVTVGILVEEHMRPLAERNREEGRRRATEDKLSDDQKVRVKHLAASAVGMSSTSYCRLRDIFAAAEADPVHYADLPTLIETTTMSGAHAELRRRKHQLDPKPEPVRRSRAGVLKGSTKGPIQVLQNTMYSLTAAANLLDEIGPVELPPELAGQWLDDLGAVTRSLSRFRARLNEPAKESLDGHG